MEVPIQVPKEIWIMGRRICVCTSGSVFKFLLPSIYHCFKALLDDFNCLAKGELYLSLAFTYKNLGAIPFCFRSLPCKPICEQECPFPNIQGGLAFKILLWQHPQDLPARGQQRDLAQSLLCSPPGPLLLSLASFPQLQAQKDALIPLKERVKGFMVS